MPTSAYPVATDSLILQAAVDELVALANSNTKMPHRPYSGTLPLLHNYNVMRADVLAVAAANLGLQDSAVSGPWPFTGLTNTYVGANNNLVFFYEDTGNTESVGVTGNMAAYTADPTSHSVGPYGTPPQYGQATVNCSIIVGGDTPVRIRCRFNFGVQGGSGAPAVTVTNDFGLTFQWAASPHYGI